MIRHRDIILGNWLIFLFYKIPRIFSELDVQKSMYIMLYTRVIYDALDLKINAKLALPLVSKYSCDLSCRWTCMAVCTEQRWRWRNRMNTKACAH